MTKILSEETVDKLFVFHKNHRFKIISYFRVQKCSFGQCCLSCRRTLLSGIGSKMDATVKLLFACIFYVWTIQCVALSSNQ